MKRVNQLINEVLTRHYNGLKCVTERADYHHEANLLLHVLSVIDRCSVYSKDLMLAALYHDLGKIDTYTQNGNGYRHENTSAWMVLEDRDKIEACGVDVDLVHFVVQNHSKYHHDRDHFRIKNLSDEKYLPALEIFGMCDNMNEDLLTEEEMNKLFLGKRVFVTDEDRNMLGGVCNFIGFNSHLGWKQVTIGRMPVTIKSFANVCTYFNIS